MADADVADMLRAWGLEQYIEVFQSKYLPKFTQNLLTIKIQYTLRSTYHLT